MSKPEDILWAERCRGCGYALLTLRNMLDRYSQHISHKRWATKKGQKAFRAILTACIGDIGLFLREGENVEIFVNDDCKTARIQSLSKEALP
ncbi:MAG: hypothetical protein ACOX63_09610 [Christensenellales bacterium]|jgi:hypothetical protein